MLLKLFEDMELGVASAATQIEGGNKNNSWYDWYLKGHIMDGADPSVADKHYKFYVSDAELMRDMGIRYYRLGIEWARLEPQQGVFDESGFKHYRNEILLLKKLGIEPLLTLHHFTDPLWFLEKGAFEAKESVDIFLKFVKKVVEELGDIVNEYITINEPNVYAASGFFFGDFPPGKKSMRLTFRVLNNMGECHIKAYKLIHETRKSMGYDDTKVSYAHHMRVFSPKDPKNFWHVLWTPILHRLFQSCISKNFLTGKACFPLHRIKGSGKGLFCDFHAVNYYSRTVVTGFSDGSIENAPVNDLGWEIYVPGIVQTTKEIYKIAKLPIYITENGTCDNTDAFRSRYIYEHVKALCESGLPIKRYYHWCFIDNFEWVEGFSARFGIVYNDYATQKRTIKKSGEFYSKMIANRGVTQEMYDEFCNVEYKTNSLAASAGEAAMSIQNSLQWRKQ